ncbi:MAG: hypothetical protein GX758_01090 [Tenericutes bacterium]|nr:hypothetical protein [Mycoplasmatota bacterium]
MEEELSNVLTVSIEDGTQVDVNVLDIIESDEFNKTFIIYTVNDNEDSIFASILNETEDSYSLDTIVVQAEIDFINKEIDEIVEELEENIGE